ncbi:MAG: drug/metabolite exporter YedA [Deltaproteobacteria bacterium]|nr:drug/metabolite exporter YedA [Deltaproteobacteria bacterium]
MLALAPTIAVRPTIDPRLILSLAAVYVIWSSTYLAMRIAVIELPPLLMGSGRFIAAGLVMLLVAIRRGTPFPAARDWLRVLPIGALLFLGGNGLVAIAQLSVTSGGAAVVCATMPLWVGVLGVITGERPSSREWLSLVIGFVGILVLMGGPSLAGEPLHIALVVAAPMCWALGSVMTRRLPMSIGKDPFMLPAMEMLTGGVALALGGALRGERIPLAASATSWLALAYLLVFGSLVAFTAYNWLLRNARPTVATSYAYVNPILAVLFGAAISDEPLGVSTFVANGLIVVAVVLALTRRKPAPV